MSICLVPSEAIPKVEKIEGLRQEAIKREMIEISRTTFFSPEETAIYRIVPVRGKLGLYRAYSKDYVMKFASLIKAGKSVEEIANQLNIKVGSAKGLCSIFRRILPHIPES